jgi:hypothetical protein
VFAFDSTDVKGKKLAEPSRVRVDTWNVGSLMGKLREVVDTIIRWRVNILCI